MPEARPSLRDQIRQVLLEDWDPSGVMPNPAAHFAYDGYIDELAELIRAGAEETAIMAFLHEREKETMCFPSLGTERLRRPARKLLGLRDTIGPAAPGARQEH